ncbi:neuropeptides B/W receptor type 1-like [Lingula anatina]|uniref:Neuropeptides B/W receptor type 1-like n=1 Tax=Lingula anatina TaxID=7574 RepID=A0A2R2MKG4_LINAN|nr:neuropeptides B/W receptor type 1-like [Lingula anatina]|eukprot:XP_023930706.1 neuropeptides B/W receptor type 1-like [Lingula anatina]
MEEDCYQLNLSSAKMPFNGDYSGNVTYAVLDGGAVEGSGCHMNESGTVWGYGDDGLMKFMMDLREISSILLPVIYGLVLVVGISGNSLVIYVILNNKKMKTCPNMLFLNLAVADLLFLLFCVPLQSAVAISKWRLMIGDVLCKMLRFTTYVTMGVSAYSLAVICMFRCRAIASPIRASQFLTRRHAITVSLIVWLAMLAFNIPTALYSREIGQCSMHTETDVEFYLLFSIISGIDFFIPVTLLALSTVAIVCHIRRSRFTPESETLVAAGYNPRIIVVLVAVTAVFVLCWGPFHVNFILMMLEVQGISRAWVVTSISSIVLASANSCLNPIIYNFVSKEFRKAFRQTMSTVMRSREHSCSGHTVVSMRSLRTSARNTNSCTSNEV